MSRWNSCAATGVCSDAVDELLRFEPAQNAVGRILSEDVEFYGTTIAAGSYVALNQASANHDPRVFQDPERLDITRSNAREHITFGGGAHRCIGAPLAQFEIPIAFDRLFDRLGPIELAGGPQYAHAFFRGFSSLPLVATRSPK
ncbi:cytochrome P450 [Streptomyces sp. NPDC090088]|uniref:cytochrome P450 n=1 Tax=Streptomyces sp. NPDC090088 TaxID=3365944 RepID=UPI00380F2F2B